MSDLTHDDVKQILDLIDRAQADYFQLQIGDLKIVVSKHAPPNGAAAPAPAPLPAAVTAAAPTAAASPPSPPPAQTPRAASTAVPEGLVPVHAPMVGVFYAQPEPGAPAYAGEGSAIDEDSTIGLIEVMKVYTAVRAGVRGTVEAVLVQNAQFVEFGQVLFHIRPA